MPEIDYAGIPRVTFSQPEISSVGLTEAQARERGHEVVTHKLNFAVLAKANIEGEGGIVKVVVEKDGPTLGVHMVGPHVTELVAEATLIYNWEAWPADVAQADPPASDAVGGDRRVVPGSGRQTAAHACDEGRNRCLTRSKEDPKWRPR